MRMFSEGRKIVKLASACQPLVRERHRGNLPFGFAALGLLNQLKHPISRVDIEVPWHFSLAVTENNEAEDTGNSV